jgi:osmoprotectant transport system substrate-binding protein
MYINDGGDVKVAGSQEFFDRDDAMPGFEEAYGFSLSGDQKVSLATGDTAVTAKAAAEGTDGVNAAMVYGTDGTIAALDLFVLDDPLGVQPIYQPSRSSAARSSMSTRRSPTCSSRCSPCSISRRSRP